MDERAKDFINKKGKQYFSILKFKRSDDARKLLEALSPAVKGYLRRHSGASPEETYRAMKPKAESLAEAWRDFGPDEPPAPEEAAELFEKGNDPNANADFASEYPAGLKLGSDGRLGIAVALYADRWHQDKVAEFGTLWGDTAYDCVEKSEAVSRAFAEQMKNYYRKVLPSDSYECFFHCRFGAFPPSGPLADFENLLTDGQNAAVADASAFRMKMTLATMFFPNGEERLSGGDRMSGLTRTAYEIIHRAAGQGVPTMSACLDAAVALQPDED